MNYCLTGATVRTLRPCGQGKKGRSNGETYAMLYEGKNIRQAVRDLIARELKAED
jgi:hypothetical protein